MEAVPKKRQAQSKGLVISVNFISLCEGGHIGPGSALLLHLRVASLMTGDPMASKVVVKKQQQR